MMPLFQTFERKSAGFSRVKPVYFIFFNPPLLRAAKSGS